MPLARARWSGRRVRRFAAGVLLAAAATARPVPAQPVVRVDGTRLYPLAEDAGVASLPERARAQAAALAAAGASTGWRFTDRLEQSGITFTHRIVDDAGKDYKAVHYDHGNGLAAADVDGDGRTDLYFSSQLGGGQLWHNLGGGRFEDWTERAGVAVPYEVGVSAAFADPDGDGDPDLFVTTVYAGNHLFENLGGGRFREVTREAGVGHRGHSSGAAFLDFDGDGDLDLAVANVGVYTSEAVGRGGYRIGLVDAFNGHLFPERAEATLLYENLGALRFAEVGAARGLVDVGWSGDVAFADLDGDLDPDLYLPNMQGDDHYWENRGGRYFDRTAELFPKTPWGTMGIAFFDYDGDGRLDLLLTDMHSDMSQGVPPEEERRKSEMIWPAERLQGPENNIFGNALFHQAAPAPDGSPRFEEVSDAAGVEIYWPWGVSVGDVDADGWPDVFVTASMNYPFRYQPNSLLLNLGGEGFLDAAFPLGVEPRRDGRTEKPWFELACDGADRERQPCQGRRGTYSMMGSLGSRSSVLFDLDGDGDLDLVTNEFNDAPQVLVSDLAERRRVRYLEVRLRGTRSNRDGLGARVDLVAGGRTQTRSHDGKSGYLSQSSLPLYFGLGDAEAADRIEVIWPSGTRQTVPGPIPANQRLTIEEPAAAPGT